ncbi:hypothetical protein ACW7G0_10970 [Lysobacter sp. A286]
MTIDNMGCRHPTAEAVFAWNLAMASRFGQKHHATCQELLQSVIDAEWGAEYFEPALDG